LAPSPKVSPFKLAPRDDPKRKLVKQESYFTATSSRNELSDSDL